MIPSFARINSISPAYFKLSGVVPTGATWFEEYNFQVDGGVIDADADIWTWKFNFRKPDSENALDLSLSTTDGTLTVTNGADATTLLIFVPSDDLSNLEGDYLAELVVETTTVVIRALWAEGIVTFRNGPVWE